MVGVLPNTLKAQGPIATFYYLFSTVHHHFYNNLNNEKYIKTR